MSSTLTYSQNKLIESSNSTTASFTSQELLNYDLLQDLEYLSDHYIVSVNNLANALNNDSINLELPNLACGILTFKSIYLEYFSDSLYTLYATLMENDSCVDFDGEFTLVSNSNGVTGHIIVDTIEYEINQIGDDQIILSKFDPDFFTDSECGNENGGGTFSEPNTGEATERSGNCTVRCMVLYTAKAKATRGDNMMSQIDKAIAQTNQALNNSEIAQSDLNVEFVGFEEVSFIETPIIDNDVNAISTDPQIIALKELYFADIVILLTDGNYGGTNGITQGIGPDSSMAYAIVNVNNATSGRYVFAHEFGHLFGAGHETDTRPGNPHGHQWRKHGWWGKKRRSLLHRAGNNPRRVLHYSNPDVHAFGDWTGIAGERNNAAIIRANACTVAAHYEEPEFIPFSAYIQGDLEECMCQTSTFTVKVFGGDPGIVQTDWYLSSDGINYSLAYSGVSGDIFYYQLPCPFPNNDLPPNEPKRVYIRIVSTSPDGQVYTDFHRLIFLPLDDEKCDFSGIEKDGNEDLSNGYAIQVYPNPSSTTQVTVSSDDFPNCSYIIVKVIDPEGNLLLQENKTVNAGSDSINLNIGSLDTGLYFLYLICPDGTYSEGKVFIKT